MKLIALFISIAVFYLANIGNCQSITVGGSNWTVSPGNIVEAGNNYSGTAITTDNHVLISASVPGLFNKGTVSVRYEANPTWHSNLILSVRRTGSGTHTCLLCTLTGGTAFQNITLSDTNFFDINSNLFTATFNNIPIQLQLTGISVTVPAASYNAKVVFTITGF